MVKDLGLKEPYRGLVELYTSEIASDLAEVLDRDFADPLGGYFDSVQPDPAAPATRGPMGS